MKTENTPSIYVGTYAKYNNGSIEGEWLDLTNYSDKEEFMDACKELHSDEEDPEFMFQDWENIPDNMISESWVSDELFEMIQLITKLKEADTGELVQFHNAKCRTLGYDWDEIYEFEDDFFNTFFEGKPMEAVRSTIFGEVNWSDNYITFNGYGNLKSLSDYDVKELIDEAEILEAYKQDPSEFSNLL